MTPERRPGDFPDPLFVVGCPRSGTTWLQLLLAQHRSVVTTKESHLFDGFLGPALRSWKVFADDPREVGLSSLLPHSEFVDRLRCFARDVLGRIAGQEDRAAVILDKTPDHALWCEALLTVFPEAWILHLVRDPRDVVASLIDAGKSWGSGWAPTSAYHAAWSWCEHVRAARSASALTERHREIRYEDLHADTETEIKGLLEWLSLDAPPEFARRAAAETQIERMRRGETRAPWDLAEEPAGFVRRGGAGGWRSELSRSDVRVVEYLCAPLMEDYGYETEHSSRLPPLQFFTPWLRDQLLNRL